VLLLWYGCWLCVFKSNKTIQAKEMHVEKKVKLNGTHSSQMFMYQIITIQFEMYSTASELIC
jgi:hypothetical protein